MLFFWAEVVLARMKFADSGGRCFIPDSTDDTISETETDFGVIAILTPWLNAFLSI